VTFAHLDLLDGTVPPDRRPLAALAWVEAGGQSVWRVVDVNHLNNAFRRDPDDPPPIPLDTDLEGRVAPFPVPGAETPTSTRTPSATVAPQQTLSVTPTATIVDTGTSTPMATPISTGTPSATSSPDLEGPSASWLPLVSTGRDG
jgi:hypothetical protein